MRKEEAARYKAKVIKVLEAANVDIKDEETAINALYADVEGLNLAAAYRRLFCKPKFYWVRAEYDNDRDCHESSEYQDATLSGLKTLWASKGSENGYCRALTPEFFLEKCAGGRELGSARMLSGELPERMDDGSKVPKRYHTMLKTHLAKNSKACAEALEKRLKARAKSSR